MTETPAKGTLTLTHTRAHGTILSGSRKGDGVFEIVRSHGFWFSRNVSGLFLKQSRDKEADHWRINRAAAALREVGHEVTIEINEDERRSFAEIEADREERAGDRADRFGARAGRAVAAADARRATADEISKRFEFGQPILLGHHSQRRAERDAERIDTNMRKSFEDRDRAKYFANRAAASESYAEHRKDPHRTLRRLERLGADLRRQERHYAEAVEKGYDSADRHARLIRDYTEEIAHWEGIVQKAKDEGVKIWGPDDFAPGDYVLHGSSWYQVARVNPKTLSIAWNLRLAPRQIMTLEDATFDGGRVGTHTTDYTRVQGRCPEEAMRAFLVEGTVPGTTLARAASEAAPADSVREAQKAAKKRAPKKRTDPKIPKRVFVTFSFEGHEATMTWLNGGSRPHKDFEPVKITPPEGEKFRRAIRSHSLQAEAERIVGEQGYLFGPDGWAVSRDRSGYVRTVRPKPSEEPPVSVDEQPSPEPVIEEQTPAAETCPMCRSGKWDAGRRYCGHCHHNPKATPAAAPSPAAEEDWQEAMAMVFIVSKNGRRGRKRGLWAMTRREAQAVCRDSRTSGRSYMLTWTERPGAEGADWAWVPDNGSLDPVLKDLGITPRRHWDATAAYAAAPPH